MGKILPRSFYLRKTETVARALLGKLLVRTLNDGTRLSGMIVETEAYVGPDDLACHSARGKTARNAAMFGLGGHAYVYFIYGMHEMFNIVTRETGRAEAVLIRALEPVEGIEHMKKISGARSIHTLANGPGKLTVALAITRKHNGIDLCAPKSPLRVEEFRAVPRAKIVAAPRIGVAYAGKWARKPLRFYIRHHPCVSRA
jgi:DNA-3-methyladenine glycosylase